MTFTIFDAKVCVCICICVFACVCVHCVWSQFCTDDMLLRVARTTGVKVVGPTQVWSREEGGGEGGKGLCLTELAALSYPPASGDMILFDIDKLVYSSKVADQYLELSRKSQGGGGLCSTELAVPTCLKDG